MSLLIGQTPEILWQNVIKDAEQNCSIELKDELERYLISLLIRYTNKPEVSKRLFATAFLEANQLPDIERQISLQVIGDECLLFAGLFPHSVRRKHVKISYFVDLGRSAYSGISKTSEDLFWSLAYEFVLLMDVLQSIRPADLLPLEAYEQWKEVGSQRAYRLLSEYSDLFLPKNNQQ